MTKDWFCYLPLNWRGVPRRKTFLSEELTPSELILERTSLTWRRLFSEKKVDATDLRLRNLVLQRKIDDEWVEATEHMLESITGWLQPKTLLVLTHNARSLLNLERPQCFANSIWCMNLDILCITETWLTKHVPANSSFLSYYSIFRSDRPKQIDFSSSHGVYWLPLNNRSKNPSWQISLVKPCDVVFALIDSSSCIFAVVHIPPKNSPYYWTTTRILDFFKTTFTFTWNSFARLYGYNWWPEFQ